MDAAKKEGLEKRAVLVLAGVFLIVFAMGPLRRMGWFSHPAPAVTQESAAFTEPVSVKPIGAMMQDLWQREQPAHTMEQVTGGVAVVPMYTAQSLRDPMESLLPKPPQPPEALPSSDSAEMASSTDAQPTAPPPVIRVQGLVWGGLQPKAIINDQIYGVDDVINNSRIVAIERDGITVDYNGSTLFYSLPNILNPGAEDSLSQQAQWR